jgi:hypothetical protein
MFQSIDQLHDNASFQLGTSQHPCTVVFGTSKFDEGKAHRSIKIMCPEMQLFKDYDAETEAHPLVKTYNDTQFTTLKIASTHQSIGELVRGVTFLAIVTPKQWKMGPLSGISLCIEGIKIINTPMRDLVFIE